MYQAIQKKIVLKLEYQRFKGKQAGIIYFHRILLKEYNNRWFLIVQGSKSKGIVNLALDRIKSIDCDFNIPYAQVNFDADEFYKNVIRVTVNQEEAGSIRIRVNMCHVPYVETKPLQQLQTIEKEMMMVVLKSIVRLSSILSLNELF